MGQWGAFGYAAQRHKTYSWILAHFYSGTKLVDRGGNPFVRVAVTENTGAPVAVTSPSAYRFGGTAIGAGRAARAILDSTTNRWRIAEASSCSQPTHAWKIVANNLVNPLAIPASRTYTAPASELLTICRADGVGMTVRGTVEAYDNAGGMRTINTVRLEEYIADVTPSESSTGWGEFGGAGPQGEQWGFQSLESQAVAARTYTLAYEAGGGWYGWADICDSGCQSYPGVLNESSLGTLAATDTAGMILETSKGAPAPTEYSASTGGYTVNNSTWAGTTPYNAVPDLGDAVCLKTTAWTCNAQHSWTASVAVTTIESTWPSIGTLRSVKVVTRYGSAKSAFGGRVATIEVVGSNGTESLPGYEWANDFNFWSDWFAVTDGPGATAKAVSRAGLSGATGASTARSGARFGASTAGASAARSGERSAVERPLFLPTGPLPIRL
jgi:SpoIID/LytB domain protein